MKAFFNHNKIAILSIASGIAIFGICFMKNAMELEDAEQAYYSQWWRWGYDDQPPLYTWLQILANKFTGVSKGSFAFVRAIIFSATIAAFYSFSKRFLKDNTAAVAVVLSLVLIPTFIDFTFRRLSHTSLLCLVVILTCITIHRLVLRKSVMNYAVLGFVIGVGLLTKYNFILFLVAAGVSVFTSEEMRKVFIHKRIVITLILSSLILLPHILWLFGDVDFSEQLQSSVVRKTQSASDAGIVIVSPIISFLLTFLRLVWPLLLLIVILFFRKKLNLKPKATDKSWLFHLFIAQLLVLIIAFVVMDVRKVEARWLLPLLLPFLVLLPKYFKESILLKCNQTGYLLFLLIILFQVIRTPAEKTFGIESSVHYGFDEISNRLQTEFSDKTWVLPDVTYAGNIRILNHQTEVFSADDYAVHSSKIDVSKSVFVVFGKTQIDTKFQLRDSIIGFGKEKEDLYFYLLEDQ